MTTMTDVKERPILFSAPMVRALLDCTKSQTRRVCTPKYSEPFNRGDEILEWREQDGAWFGLIGWRTAAHCKCRYGQPGERLWVREAHWIDTRDPKCAVMDVDGYVVDCHKLGRSGIFVENMDALRTNKFWRKRPSIHMPRWASRITLEVTGVRVERLQDISEADAIAEGIDSMTGDKATVYHWGFPKPMPNHAVSGYKSARAAYTVLWESINGPDSWADNPWVWVIEFSQL